MLKKLELGIICNLDGDIVNHRSLVKVLFNPFLRMFGFYIGTIYEIDSKTLGKPALGRCSKKRKFKFLYDNDIEYKIVKRRRII